MARKLRTRQLYTRTQTGATLAAALILVTAGMLLAISALRSATTEARLSSTLVAAQDAFWLAEQGVASGINFASNRPVDLPELAPLNLPTHTTPGHGRAEIIIYPSGTDTDCPSLAPHDSIRRHYEIQATGVADLGAVSTHVQGFYICSEICLTLYCDIQELAPVKSYWKAITGGIPP